MSEPPDQLRVHFAGLWLREDGPQGQVYAGRDINGSEVTIAVLAEALAARSGMRNAFAGVVWHHSVGPEPGRPTVYAADIHAPRPWAATRGRYGEPGAEQFLAALAGAAPTDTVQSAAVIPPPPPPLPAGRAPAAATTGQPGHPPGPPARSRNEWPWVLAGAGAVVAVALLAVLVVVGVRMLRDGDADPPVTQPTAPPAETPETPEAARSPAPELTGEPVSLVGPTYAPDADTYTMDFQGWPFAFRAPNDWTCALAEELPGIPDGDARVCFSERVQGGVLLWECDAGCDEQEQREMLDRWLDEPDRAVQWGDSPTFYVETEENDDGLYTLQVGHFFGTESEDPRWMVGTYFESLPEDREDAQRVVNDILNRAR